MDTSGSVTPTYTPVAALKEWKLDLKRARADATCFGDPNKVYVQGLPDIAGDLTGVWDETESPVLFGVALGETAVMLKLIPSTLTPTYFFSGLAYLDTSIDVKADGVIEIKGTFAGAGAWTMDPPLP